MLDYPTTRRAVLLATATLAATGASTVRAQTTLSDEIVPLWPSGIPGEILGAVPRSAHAARGDAHAIHHTIADQSRDPAQPDRWISAVETPMLVVRRAAQPNGAAVLVMPGGGYGFLSYDNEGESQAAWLTARGITAFILLYRLPSEGWATPPVVPLQDAQRALRLIRAEATRFRIDPGKIAILGFSAGGHLAGSLATRFAEPTYAPRDRIDRVSARPDLVGLLYPVVSLEAAYTHGGSRDNLLGRDAPAALRHAASVDTRVTADTPPTFLVHAADDRLVPIANSLSLYTALLAQRRPCELHAFETGGHGFGVRLPRTLPAAAWPGLFHAFGASKLIFPV